MCTTPGTSVSRLRAPATLSLELSPDFWPVARARCDPRYGVCSSTELQATRFQNEWDRSDFSRESFSMRSPQ